MTSKETILKQYFGYETFRGGQETLIDGILAGCDVLGIMPTGAGKSLCFQVPALMFGGLTLCVSPLISLMKDQVAALIQSGVAAAFINSSLTDRQIAHALQKARAGAYRIIYVAPERLLAPEFIAFAQSVTVSMVTVDEAHCISQWGQDFRPSYSKIPLFIESLPNRPVVSAFTATATPRVREDIVSLLQLNAPILLATGFDRPNLYFDVQKPHDKYSALTAFLSERKEKSGIIYCATRATVEEVCAYLQRDGYNAARYHAGLSDRERHDNQDHFIYDRVQIMVATNAFGMGIDKSNVSYVVHYNMPKDIESYYQEAGRAGRDGTPADCLLLYSGQDVRTSQWLIEHSRDSENIENNGPLSLDEMIERDRKRLREMTFYSVTSDCLRGYILKYFGETPPYRCENCGTCDEEFELVDITVDAQKILSCVVRMKERFGMKMVIDVLRGSRSEKVRKLGLDTLSTYGCCAKGERYLYDVMNYLIIMGYLQKTDDQYPVVKLGENARRILRDGQPLEMKITKGKIQAADKPDKQTAVKPVDMHLFRRLRELRLAIANAQGVPAFVVFSDSALTDMCVKKPTTEAAFLEVSGVGRVKAERYGEQFISEISAFLRDAD